MGVKNASNFEKCANVWFNELRLSELENEGGWAAIASLDTNFADFANISMTGKRSTIGFGSVEQGLMSEVEKMLPNMIWLPMLI